MIAFAYSILCPGAFLLLLGALQEIVETVNSQNHKKKGKISSPNEHNALIHYSHFPPPSKCEERAMSWKQVCAGGRPRAWWQLDPSTPCYSDPIKQIPHYAKHAQTIPATQAHLSLQHGLLFFFFLTQIFLLEASAYAEELEITGTRRNWKEKH